MQAAAKASLAPAPADAATSEPAAKRLAARAPGAAATAAAAVSRFARNPLDSGKRLGSLTGATATRLGGFSGGRGFGRGRSDLGDTAFINEIEKCATRFLYFICIL